MQISSNMVMVMLVSKTFYANSSTEISCGCYFLVVFFSIAVNVLCSNFDYHHRLAIEAALCYNRHFSEAEFVISCNNRLVSLLRHWTNNTYMCIGLRYTFWLICLRSNRYHTLPYQQGSRNFAIAEVIAKSLPTRAELAVSRGIRFLR